jgi:type I restriction enzyme S subunit
MEGGQMKRNPYPKYKASGVECLGDVPEHWDVKRFKYIARLQTGNTPSKSDSENYSDEGMLWIKPDDLSEFIPIIDTKEYLSDKGRKEARVIPPYSPLVCCIGTIGKFGYSEKEVTTNQQINSIKYNNKILARYGLYQIVVSEKEHIKYANTNVVSILNAENQSQICFPVPPLSEQQSITDFLDRETGRMDTLIGKNQKLIELLKEKRTVLISRAVTKGLNPKVKMKPSGVEWVGDVPVHWEVKAIKWETPVFRGASPRPIDDPVYFDDEGEYAWVRIADVTASHVYLEETTQRLSDIGANLSVKLNPGKLFLSIAATVGVPCITKIKCCIHDGFVHFPRLKSNTKFMYYIFDCGEPYKGLGKLGTQLNLNTDTVGSIVMGFPPLAEQQAIVAFLDHETGKIDVLVAKVETAIEKLKEYRTALISAVVTGKIDVREVA